LDASLIWTITTQQQNVLNNTQLS